MIDGADTAAVPFHRLLRDYRRHAGLSGSALARRANVDPSYLSRLETGKRPAPRPEVLEALCRALAFNASQRDALRRAAGLPFQAVETLGDDPLLAQVAGLICRSKRFRRVLQALADAWERNEEAYSDA